MTYHLLVTGTRFGRFEAEDWFQYMVDTYGEPLLWIFGDCKGVDTQCKLWCEKTKRQFQKFDADWDTFGDAAGPIRNGVMVEFTNEVEGSKCLALPMQRSQGTLDCIKQATIAKLHVVIK